MEFVCCAIATIGLHLGSAHLAPLPDQPKFNNSNPGVYVEMTNHVVVGAFHNSLRPTTAYVAYNFELAHAGPVAFGVVLAGATGYPAAPVVPLVLPYARLPITPRAALRVGYLPRTRYTGAHVVHFMLEYKF